MSFSIGTPVMMLDRNNHFGDNAKKHGNARAVLCEAMSERQCKDEDLDESLTKTNTYYMPTAYYGDGRKGNNIAYRYENLAEEYRIVDRNGKEKKLRSDANIAFAGIIKPDKEFMKGLSKDEQDRLLNDSFHVICDIYSKRGMKIEFAVIHRDEGNPHMHYFGYDPDYKLSDKFNLTFFKALNVTDFPKQMRNKGWDVKDLTGYTEATKGMSESEVEQYKAKRKASRKSGKSSADYKKEQDIKKTEQAKKAVEDDLRRLEANKAKYIMQVKKEAAEAALREAATIKEKALAEAAKIKPQFSEDVLAKAKRWDEYVAERNKRLEISSDTNNLFGIDYSR